MSSTGAWIDYMSTRDRLPEGGKVMVKGNVVLWEREELLARFLGHGIVKWTYTGGIDDLVHDINQ